MDSKTLAFLVHEFWVGGEYWLFKVGSTNSVIIDKTICNKKGMIYRYVL